MGRLRSWRHSLAIFLNELGAITNGENPFVPRGLQMRIDGQLIDPVGFQTADVGHKLRYLDAGGPDHQVRFNEITVFGVQAVMLG